MAEFQLNFIYGHEKLEFHLFLHLSQSFFLLLILIQPFKKVKAILNLVGLYKTAGDLHLAWWLSFFLASDPHQEALDLRIQAE